MQTRSLLPGNQTDSNLKCSRCGAGASLKRDILCVANTKWGYEQNAEIDIGSMVRKASAETVVDDKKEWHVALCDSCSVKGYRDYLAYLIKDYTGVFKVTGIISAVSLVLLVPCMIWAGPSSGPTLGTVLGLGFLGGGIVAIASGLDVLGKRRELRKANTLATPPEKQLDNAFDGEAKRILENMEAGRTDFYGSFELPQFSTESRKGRVRGISFRSISLVTKETPNAKT